MNNRSILDPPSDLQKTSSHSVVKVKNRAPAPAESAEEVDQKNDDPAAKSVPEAPPAKKGNKRKIILIGIAALLIVSAGVAGYLRYSSGFVSTDDAYLSGDVHPVSARVNGTVASVLIDDNQAVKPGEVLLQLDPRDLLVQLEQKRGDLRSAQAAVTQADAQISQARAQLAQTEAQIAQTASQLEKSTLDRQRGEDLLQKKVIARSEFDTVKSAYDVAVSNAANSGAGRDAAVAAIESAVAARAAGIARQQTAEASVADAELQLSYTTIPAPTEGHVGKKSVQVGQRVQPGQALLAVVSGDSWIVANFKENQLTRMRAGQAVDIEIDAVSGHEFTGTVESFSPGTGAQFALLPPDNATGNFTKVVQRLPVKIRFDRESVRGFEDRLTPGLSAVVKVRLPR